MILFYSFVISFVMTFVVFKFLKKIKISQPIYELAPDKHLLKAGTPTMGGLGFISAILFFLLVFLVNPDNNKLYIYTCLIIILGFGFIGFKDDILKIRKKSNQEGLTPKQKLLLQFLISLAIIPVLYISEINTEIDFLGKNIDLGFLYFLLVPIFIVGFSNAFNISDGLDGLLTSNSIILFTYAAFSAISSENQLLFHLNLVIIGTLIGFLCLNFYPAKIFMGDVGSLTLGALFALDMVLLEREIDAFVISGFILLEISSVVIQVSYFKYTKKRFGKGKRIFLKAPFHHHLEARGMSEKKIVFVSCVCTSLLALATLII